MAKGIMANSAMNAAAGLTLLVTGFICSIVAARLLGPEANGIIAFALWLTATGALVAELGTGITLLGWLPRLKVQGFTDAQRRGFAAYLAWPVVAASVILLGAYGLSFWQTERLHFAVTAPAVLVITGGLFFLQSIGSFSKNYLIGEQRLGSFFSLTLATSALQLVGVVAGAVLFGVEGALAGYILGQAAPFLYTLTLLAARPNSCGVGGKYLLNSSLILSLQLVIDSIFLNRPELFFLQRSQGIEMVGFYAAGLSLANLALQLPVQLTGSLLPYYSEQVHSQPDRILPIHVFEGVVRAIAYITLPMSFGLAAIAPELSVAVFGQAFRPSGNILALLAIGAPVYVFMQICTQYMLSMDHIRQRLWIGIAGSVVMVGGCLIVVPGFGGEGAASVRFCVFLVMCVLMVRQMSFGGSWRALTLALARIAIAALGCGIAAWTIVSLLAGWLGLASAVLAGALVYGVLLRLFRAIPTEDVAVLQRILGRLPGRMRAPATRLLAMMAS